MQENQKDSFFQVEKKIEKKIAILFLNRPEARNAMDERFWFELPKIIDALEQDQDVNVVLITGIGKSFSIGLDLVDFYSKYKDLIQGETANERQKFHQLILQMQEGLKKIVLGKKIYIAAVHKHCIGGGLDLISCCDIRIAAKNAIVSLREAKVGIVADMGSLNRLPYIIGTGATKLLAYTGGDFTAEECFRMGLFDKIVENEEDLFKEALQLSEEIASNPPIVLEGIKKVINYVENHSFLESMDFVALWNATYLDSNEFREIIERFLKKKLKK